ncbi:MAG: aminotransferase class I/II-fold pyridoxal phosphate-dependent enzyme [Acidobacteria bacterium]|nr:aminotransferase class I/II-fold pyridoxal phosphate-dependent enzyme [Acidobacteriota bacterium]MCW5967514.1 aminotransferase class I/II-fold pyridoxal phosphate-dependent enzyme [Blastocatellales bacterium]
MSRSRTSRKAKQFTESVIREMTRQAILHGAVNLSQGFPDFPAPVELKQAACAAIEADINQYAITWGAKRFREAIAEKTRLYLGLEIDPEREVVVTCGSTEAMIAAMMAVVDPGDEVIVFEPFYENYGPDAILTEASIRYVTLHPPEWSFDPDELRRAFNDKTRAIIITTPHNPTGKVFTREELRFIADLCIEHDAIALTDEIYEHILYPEAGRDVRHTAMATLDGMRDRTVTINGLSKTYSVTGWRVGYAIASPEITDAVRKVHDFLTVGAAAPLQEAGVTALNFPPQYYEKLASDYRRRRDFLLGALEETGFRCFRPYGAYYIMTDISDLGFDDDMKFGEYMVREIGVAVVPGSSFYRHPELGRRQVRFTYCKRDETLEAAAERLRKLR